MPPVDGPSDLVDLFIVEGCQPDDGTTIEARSEDGSLVDSCVTSNGVCSISGSFSNLPLTLTQVGLEPEVNADVFELHPSSESLTSQTRIVPLINISGSVETEILTSTSVDSEVLQPTGDLAYAIKNGDHWDIWVYSFDTQKNAQLASESNSDQWAPAYSHDGTRLAYISDQSDGSNQIWLMDPDGANKRQTTEWHGAESILYVA